MRLSLIGFLGILMVFLAVEPAFALRVSLQRLLFENKSRSQVVNIINESDKEQTYRIGWKNFRMSEDTMLSEVKKGEELADLKIAEPYLRYAPRRIAIPPNSAQQVRIIARFTSDMEDGEYRSHLYIAPEAEQEDFSQEVEESIPGRQVIKINMLTGISMPVFIRKGNLQVSSRIENTVLTREEGGLYLIFDLLREGNRSLFGDMDFICTDGGKEQVLQQSIGVAVYTEVRRRKLSYKIKTEEPCQNLDIVYRAEADDSQYKGGEIARASVQLQ